MTEYGQENEKWLGWLLSTQIVHLFPDFTIEKAITWFAMNIFETCLRYYQYENYLDLTDS